MDSFDICIVGAGAVGLAIAYQLSSSVNFRHRSIVILERESNFGQHSSSRNSEVIHAGIYYATDSLKAKLCVRGKQLLYEHCERFDIPYRRLGKLIVAQENDSTQLQSVARQAMANGVTDLRWLDQRELQATEPAICAETALFSPSSGIFDSHSYMLSLLHLAQNNGVQFAPHTTVRSIERETNQFKIYTTIGTAGSAEPYQFHCRMLVNSAGLDAQSLAHKITGLAAESIPPLHLCKGDYFAYTGKSPFKSLVYPLPETNTQGLGIHTTLDLSAQLRFGPDTEYVEQIDYEIKASKATEFAAAVSRYFPAISADKLIPAYSGIRPKLTAAGEPAADFVIQKGEDFAMPGLIQLFGIESPGLTASLAIGEYVLSLLSEVEN